MPSLFLPSSFFFPLYIFNRSLYVSRVWRIPIGSKALGAEHPHVAVSLNELGKVFGKLGKYDKALLNYKRASAGAWEMKSSGAENDIQDIRFRWKDRALDNSRFRPGKREGAYPWYLH
jgi:hypothetical protein